MKLSIVIPARDEAGNIGSTVDALRARLTREAIRYEIIVVDDGSVDATAAETLARRRLDEDVRLIQNPGPHGFGYAVRCGLDAMTGDAVAIVMADSSDSPEDVVRYFYVVRDEAECAFGSRFLPGSRVENYPWFKLLINRLANQFIRVLFGLRYNDVTNAFKAYRTEVIAGCRPFLSPHFNLTVELPLKAIVRGYSYAVVPITWRQRTRGVSRLRLKEMGSRYLYIILTLWLEKTLTQGDYRRPTAPLADLSPPAARCGARPRAEAPRLGLVLVLLGAALLRLWATGLGHDLVPFQLNPTTRVSVSSLSFQIDEGQNTWIPTTLSWGQLNPHAFYLPALLWYLYFVLDQVVFWLGRAIGIFALEGDLRRLVGGVDPAPWFLLARSFNTLLGSATIGLVYMLGRRLFSTWHGLVAAAFCAGSFLHVRDSALATSDAPTTLFVALSLVGAAGMLQKGRLQDYAVAAMGAGLAAATKYNAILVLLAPILAHALRAVRCGTSLRRVVAAPRLCGMILGALSVFLVFNPYLVLDWPGARADLVWNYGVFQHGRFVDVGPGWWYHLTVSLRYGVGLILLGLAALGIGRTVWRRDPGGLMLLGFGAPFFLVMGSGKLIHVRYMTPLLPILCLFAAMAALALADRLAAPAGRRWVGLVAMIVLALLEPVGSALAYGRIAHRLDTRVQTYEFLLTLPPRSKIATYGSSEVWRSVLPRWEPLYYAKDPRQTWADVFAILKARGTRYLLVHTSDLDVFSPTLPDLEAELPRSASLIKEFSPYAPGTSPHPVYDRSDPFYFPIGRFGGVKRPGPLVRLYRLD